MGPAKYTTGSGYTREFIGLPLLVLITLQAQGAIVKFGGFTRFDGSLAGFSRVLGRYDINLSSYWGILKIWELISAREVMIQAIGER
jgi:hypothetical protein